MTKVIFHSVDVNLVTGDGPTHLQVNQYRTGCVKHAAKLILKFLG